MRFRPGRRGGEGRRAAYYNTTGIAEAGTVRHRSRWFGQLRFNETGDFDATLVERNIGRVFVSSGELDRRRVQLFLRHRSDGPVPPDYFLFAVRSDRTGILPIGWHGWKSDGVLLLSWSQSRRRQEAMVLMPPDSWIRGRLGWFVAEPLADRPWRAFLRLVG
jgi:hypothetical protein